MRSRGLNAIAACVLAVMILPSCSSSTERSPVDFERMRQQQRYDPYEASPFFPNGAVMQAPPEHTVPRDESFASAGGAAPPGYLTGSAAGKPLATIPISIDAAAFAQGASHFAVSCAPCHGAGGYGGGPIAPNLVEKRPPNLRSAAIASLSPGALFSVITDGFGRMPPYGWQLTPAERWAVVAYVRELASQPTNDDVRTDSATADYLTRLDSLHAAGASVDEILRLKRPPS
jgi:mono/diheme cytochrome c family protein